MLWRANSCWRRRLGASKNRNATTQRQICHLLLFLLASMRQAMKMIITFSMARILWKWETNFNTKHTRKTGKGERERERERERETEREREKERERERERERQRGRGRKRERENPEPWVFWKVNISSKYYLNIYREHLYDLRIFNGKNSNKNRKRSIEITDDPIRAENLHT